MKKNEIHEVNLFGNEEYIGIVIDICKERYYIGEISKWPLKFVTNCQVDTITMVANNLNTSVCISETNLLYFLLHP